ncbi:unnamed protein product [Choristocarpus tenellus]
MRPAIWIWVAWLSLYKTCTAFNTLLPRPRTPLRCRMTATSPKSTSGSGFGQKKDDSSDVPKDETPSTQSEEREIMTGIIGTLYSSRGEVIRELNSNEYLEVMRDWAPVASFAASQADDEKIKASATSILESLRGMAQWQPKKKGDYRKPGSKFAFGVPFVAVKNDIIDALACLQVSEEEGVVIEWICQNPFTLGVEGNAVEWLTKGIVTLCSKRLEMPVTVAPAARLDSIPKSSD